MKYLRLYTRPRKIDQKGVDYDLEGRITFKLLEEWMKEDLLVAQYVLCGPEGLVHDLMKGLLNAGVQRESIQFECFGPLSTSLEQFSY